MRYSVVTDDPLLLIEEVADELRCSTKTVRRIIERGEVIVTSLTDSPKGDRIARSDLEDYKRSRRRRKTCRSNVATTGELGKSLSLSAGKRCADLRVSGRGRTRSKSNGSSTSSSRTAS